MAKLKNRDKRKKSAARQRNQERQKRNDKSDVTLASLLKSLAVTRRYH